jgi:lysophospholipid acyltransferase (LPLAT)-like uncharacterized protein
MHGAEPEPSARAARRRPWWRAPLLAATTAVAPPLIALALRLLQATLRIEYLDAAPLRSRLAAGERVIIAFWHNRMMAMPLAARGAPVCILVSQHRDGEIATRTLRYWGIRAVRGSATRGAVPGFLRLVDAYRRGSSLAVVPDGPRGPRYVAKSGIVHLAKATGAAIYPVSYAASRCWRLRSWDRLIIPKPFAALTIAVGAPLRVDAAADDASLRELRDEIEARLNDLTERVEARHDA